MVHVGFQALICPQLNKIQTFCYTALWLAFRVENLKNRNPYYDRPAFYRETGKVYPYSTIPNCRAMNRIDKIFLFHNILKNARAPVPRKYFEEKLDCSRSTFSRIVEEMIDYFNAPLKYDKRQNGWFYDQSENAAYELPGLWLDSSELYALLSSYELLSQAQPEIMQRAITPFRKRIEKILHLYGFKAEEIKRVRIIPSTERAMLPTSFRTIAESVLSRKKLKIVYHGRERSRETEREISPQRLVHYRDNWYLDAWCHTRRGLRTFSVDRIKKIVLLDKAAKNLLHDEMDKTFTAAYGIFSGKGNKTAIIHFSGNAAKWVENERWHPNQNGRWERGIYKLTLPYSDHRELIMDILRWIPDVEIAGPPELREEFAKRVYEAWRKIKKK